MPFFFSFSGLLCVYMIVHGPTSLRVCVWRSVPAHQWVEAMWNEIYQSQRRIVMKALRQTFTHYYCRALRQVVFFFFFNENSPQLFWFTGSRYSFNLCWLHRQLNWPVARTGPPAKIGIIQKLFSGAENLTRRLRRPPVSPGDSVLHIQFVFVPSSFHLETD